MNHLIKSPMRCRVAALLFASFLGLACGLTLPASAQHIPAAQNSPETPQDAKQTPKKETPEKPHKPTNPLLFPTIGETDVRVAPAVTTSGPDFKDYRYQ